MATTEELKKRLAAVTEGSGAGTGPHTGGGADDMTFNTGSPAPTNTPTPATTTPATGTTPTTSTTTPTTGGTVAPTGTGTPATGTGTVSPTSLPGMYEARRAESEGKIEDLYGKGLEAQKLALKSAYEQNLSDQEAARGNIGGAYQQSSNDLAVQYERNRRNLNEQALARGLNTGAGSQQQLALQQGYMSSYGKLRGEEAAAIAEAERQIVNLKNQYNNDVAQAIADNDYKKAAALLDDYNNDKDWMDKQAAILAEYGDFSAYAAIYGPEQAAAMEKTWVLQNPDLAWALGKITKEEYRKVTGRNPGGTGGGYGGGGYSMRGGYWHNGVWHSNSSSSGGGGDGDGIGAPGGSTGSGSSGGNGLGDLPYMAAGHIVR